MGIGLNEASSFLLGMKRDAEKPSMAGFNIPPQVLTADEFKKAAQIFISPDGHAARYFVQSALNPFSTAAMDQVESDRRRLRGRPNRIPSCRTPRYRWREFRRGFGTPATITTTTSGSSSSRPSSLCF